MEKRSYKFRIFKTIIVIIGIIIFVYGLGRIVYDVFGMDNRSNNNSNQQRHPSNVKTV